MRSTPKIEWTMAFQEDVAEVFHFLEYQYCSESQKNKLWEKLNRTQEKLALFPGVGILLDDASIQERIGEFGWAPHTIFFMKSMRSPRR